MSSFFYSVSLLEHACKGIPGSTGSFGFLSKRVIKADGGTSALIAKVGAPILGSNLTRDDQLDSSVSQPVGPDPHRGSISDILHIRY